MAKITLDPITSGYNLAKINANFQELADELNNKVLYRDPPEGEPNHMEDTLDMNSNRIINLPEPVNENEAARLRDVQNAIAGIISANFIPFTPYSPLQSDTVQGALQEVADDLRKGKVVDSIEELKNLLYSDYTRVFVTGYFSAGDGGGGHYRYDSSDVISADNLGSIIVADDGGRWKLIQTSPLSVKQFGARGNAVSDDQPAIQATIEAVITSGGGTVYFPGSGYFIGSPVVLNYSSNPNRFSGKIHLKGDSSTASFLYNTGAFTTLSVVGSTSVFEAYVDISNMRLLQ